MNAKMRIPWYCIKRCALRSLFPFSFLRGEKYFFFRATTTFQRRVTRGTLYRIEKLLVQPWTVKTVYTYEGRHFLERDLPLQPRNWILFGFGKEINDTWIYTMIQATNIWSWVTYTEEKEYLNNELITTKYHVRFFLSMNFQTIFQWKPCNKSKKYKKNWKLELKWYFIIRLKHIKCLYYIY